MLRHYCGSFQDLRKRPGPENHTPSFRQRAEVHNREVLHAQWPVHPECHLHRYWETVCVCPSVCACLSVLFCRSNSAWATLLSVCLPACLCIYVCVCVTAACACHELAVLTLSSSVLIAILSLTICLECCLSVFVTTNSRICSLPNRLLLFFTQPFACYCMNPSY